MHRTILALLAVAFALSAADKTYVLTAAHMFDGKSDHVVSPGLVVVSNGKITAVGSAAAIPAGAETIDLGDATLLPGLMVVSNGKITAVGSAAAIPAGAETIDLGDATLLPGLMVVSNGKITAVGSA